MGKRTRDSAKSTFDKAMERAKYIFKLAGGLTDHRKRSVRRDWSGGFKKLMHWPKSHKIERVDSKDVVLIIRDNSNLTRKDFSSDALRDLLRASLVMAVSAMDAYFHAKVLRYVVVHSKSRKPSKRLLNERITVRDFIEGQRKERSFTALRAAIERNLSYQSLQHPDNIADALNLIGVSDFWGRVAKKLGKSKDGLRKEISSIVRRRNQIAHEGDLCQSARSRNKSRTITLKFVSSSIDLIETLVDAADNVINQSLSPGRVKVSP